MSDPHAPDDRIVPRTDRICVLGAGPAGLATAYYLRQAGYEHVTVLEKLGRVGGLCVSETFDGKSFDLGANYVTSAYTRVRQLAKQVGAKMYIEAPAICMDPATGAYHSLFTVAKGDSSLLAFGWATVRYVWERWKLRAVFPSAGFVGVSDHPELMQEFSGWLESKNLSALSTLFQIPIRLMGYGDLDEIPTPYALRYMTIGSFLNLLVYGAGIPKPFRRWPRRFIDGFQRFWQKIAWDLDVRLNANVTKIERGKEIRVHVRFPEQVMQDQVEQEETLTFDRLVLCCPLSLDVLDGFLDLTDRERRLFSQIVVNPFCVTTYSIPGLDLRRRLVNLMPNQALGRPYIVTQQFEGNPLVTFYTRADVENRITREEVLQQVQVLIKELQGTPEQPVHSYDRWPYFPHVELESFAKGFYDELAGIQGERNTYFSGGLLAFELIEPIVEFADQMVDRHFVGSNVDRSTGDKT